MNRVAHSIRNLRAPPIDGLVRPVLLIWSVVVPDADKTLKPLELDGHTGSAALSHRTVDHLVPGMASMVTERYATLSIEQSGSPGDRVDRQCVESQADRARELLTLLVRQPWTD